MWIRALSATIHICFAHPRYLLCQSGRPLLRLRRAVVCAHVHGGEDAVYQPLCAAQVFALCVLPYPAAWRVEQLRKPKGASGIWRGHRRVRRPLHSSLCTQFRALARLGCSETLHARLQTCNQLPRAVRHLPAPARRRAQPPSPLFAPFSFILH